MPTSTRKEKEEHIEKLLEIAEQHRKKNSNVLWEIRCLNGACKDYVRISVDFFDEPSDAIDYLKSENFPKILKQTIEKISEEYDRFKNSQRRQVINDISLVHFSWLMGMHQEANIMAKICADESIWKFQPGTKFWNEYHRVVGNYIEGKTYVPNYPKPSGYERYWPPYLALMNAITEKKPIDGPLKEIDESFIKRNKDKRLTDYGFDGDGNEPVKWDLRKVSILKTMGKIQSVS